MFVYFIALLWALISPAHNQTNSNTGNQQVTVMDADGDTGGETGTIPPKPPTPPKP